MKRNGRNTLVELRGIRGDPQMHTTAIDGKNTLAEMVEACAARGYEYIAITDAHRIEELGCMRYGVDQTRVLQP